MTITITVIKIKNEKFYTARKILVKKRRIVYDEPHKKCNKKEVPKNEIWKGNLKKWEENTVERSVTIMNEKHERYEYKVKR